MGEANKKPMVRVRPYSYQPSKAELDEDVAVNASPEEVRAALLVRPVTVEESDDA